MGTAGIPHDNNQLGGVEYSVKNDGILAVGDTVVLMEGNVTLYSLSGYNDYTSSSINYLTRWLAMTFQTISNEEDTFKEIWNSTNVPADIEITIVHVPTKSIIYQGSVRVH
jgi:hypothetical protein